MWRPTGARPRRSAAVDELTDGVRTVDDTDTARIARATAAETVRRLTRDQGVGTVDLRAGEVEACLRDALRDALRADRQPQPDPFLALCAELDLTRAALDALGHHLLTALLPHRVGPDALIRVGRFLSAVRRRLPAPGPPNGGPVRHGRPQRNGASGRYRSARQPEHLPSTPSWTCTGCGEEWPCATKQSQLLAEYGGASTGLAVYLGSCLLAAVQDLPALPVARARNRFLGWLPRARL